MDNQVHNSIVSFIWGIADDCLRDVYVRGKYRDVILPMTVIRRLDALLEDSKDAVLEMKKRLDAAKIDNQWPALCNAAGQAFCNASPFRLRDLTSRAKKQTLKADFIAYLDGFSPNVQVILDKFKFRNQIDTMVDADILGAVIEKFVSSDINLSPNPVWKDEAKTIMRHPGLDNHGMGTIFEELIRRFNEENNEEAGEHWTPRDVVELMADLVFMPVADKIQDATYSCYDGACGTGGMLTVAQERLLTLGRRRGKDVSIHLFGQEINPETYAICTADMLLKGDGDQAEHIDLSSYRNEAREMISIRLEDQDAEIAPVPAGKTGHIVEPEMDLLSRIISDFNDMFGNINWNDADNVQRQILEIPAMVSRDKKYQNAMRNSDEQSARLESERALQQVIFAIMADNMELFKQFQDNPSFKKWLSDLVFNLTYNPEGKEYVMPGPGEKTVAYDFPTQESLMVAEDPATYGDKKDEE